MKNHTKSDESAGREAGSGVRNELLELLSGRPELAARFGHFQAAFADQNLVPERLLEICRARLDRLHGLTPTEPALPGTKESEPVRAGDFSSLSAAEVAALSLAEQMALDAHGVSAGQISDLAEALGEPGAVTLLTAIALFDANARMQRVLQPLREQRAAVSS